MANDVSVAGPKTYGGLKPSGSVGADGFAAHDASKAWTDGGAGEALVNRIANDIMGLSPEIAAYGAEQAKQAVLEYMTNAYGDICVVNGELCFLIDSSNNEASFGVFWKLRDTLQKAMAEAENAGDQATLQAIGGFIQQLSGTFRAPIDAGRAPARQLRPGNPKPPAVAGRTGGGAARPATRPNDRPGAAHNARVAATPPRSAS